MSKKQQTQRRENRKRRNQRRRLTIEANAVKSASDLRIEGDSSDFAIEAAAGDGEGKRVRKFTMTAYTGGSMQVNALYWPVVVDLAGMDAGKQSRPIFRDHDPGRIVGHTDAIDISAQRIKLSGIVSGTGEDAQSVVALADNGFPWQASIGAPASQLEFVERGQTVKVNGRNFSGPIYVARKTTLREVSFVALGADDNTSAAVAAKLAEEGDNMNKFEKWLKANGFDPEQLTDQQQTILRAHFDAEQASGDQSQQSQTAAATVQATATQTAAAPADNGGVDILAQLRQQQAAEIERTQAITSICAQYGVDTVTIDGAKVNLQAHAVREGWTVEQVELHALRARRPQHGPAIHKDGNNSPAVGVIEAALALHSGVEKVEDYYTPQVLEAADKQFKRGIALQEMLLISATANGYTGRSYRITDGNLETVLRAAFSSSDLSGILSNVANKLLMMSFGYTEQTWRRVSAIGSVNDFKTHTRYRLIGDAQFEKVAPTGELKHGNIADTSYTNQADTYGKMFGISRQDIINDDLGALNQMTRRIGRGAGLKLNDVFWTEFLDNSSFFTSGNANYFDGAATTLQSSSLQTAEQKFMDQTDEEGKPLGAMPSILLTPTALGVTNRELYTATNINTGGSSTKDKVPNVNVWNGRFRPEVSAYLGNSSYTGYSSTAWYLLADPQDLPVIETVFLNGMQEPTVETAQADFNTLGIQMRGYFDFGVNKQEYRGGVKSKGAA